MAFAMIFTFNSIIFAANGGHSELPTEIAAPGSMAEDEVRDTNTDETKEEAKSDMTQAGETVVNRISRKERRIAELTDKYNDAVYGKVAYYLEVAQKYSLPICFIGIAIGSFNFLIVGNKKLDKKEQGYGWIVGFVIGLVVFNVMPLIFALFVAGR